jgi:opacity protein-like surface antigen
VSARLATQLAFAALLALAAAPARAQDAAPDSAGAPGTSAAPAEPAHRRDGLEALEPALAEDAYHLSPGPRPYLHRLAVTPAFGALGSERLFAMRVAYNPNEWLGYEAELAHNPGQAVHAVVHRLSLVVRRPLPGRLQPYVTAGYGMAVVLPGHSVNADAVTKNLLALGGGLELYIRDDLALRAEMRRSTVFGRQANREGLVAYDYLEQTLGLSFYRTLRP